MNYVSEDKIILLNFSKELENMKSDIADLEEN